jgi:hypothetical protein
MERKREEIEEGEKAGLAVTLATHPREANHL